MIQAIQVLFSRSYGIACDRGALQTIPKGDEMAKNIACEVSWAPIIFPYSHLVADMPPMPQPAFSIFVLTTPG